MAFYPKMLFVPKCHLSQNDVLPLNVICPNPKMSFVPESAISYLFIQLGNSLHHVFSNAFVADSIMVSQFLKYVLFFLDAFFQLDLFSTSTFSEVLILLSCLSNPKILHMGSVFCPFVIKSSALFAISWSSMSSALATSDAEGSSLFSITACRTVTLPMGMLKPKSRILSLPNIFFMESTDFSLPFLFVKGLLLPS